MGDENPIHTLGDYPKPSHEGYRNTIELPVGNNVVPLRSETIRTRRLFQFSLRDQVSNCLERLPVGSITTWEDLTTRFLAQFFPPGRTAKLHNDILMFQQHHGESLSEAWTHQVQCWMEAHLAPIQPTQVNKVTTSCEICSGPHDTLYCMEDPEQAFVEYVSSRTDEVGDARLSKFEADFKQQQSEMTNKVDIVLKAITDRIAGTLPGDKVKNPKLSTYPVLFARSYPTEDPQCSTHIHGSINTITIHPKQQNNSRDSMAEEEE
ncbi:MAK10-like protein [Tanacetum coccineum]